MAGLRVLHLDYPDWDSVEGTKASLTEAIKVAGELAPEQLVTPISHAINLQQLTESQNPIEAVLAEVDSTVKRLDQRLTFIETDLVLGLGLEKSTAQRWAEMNRYWAQKKAARDQLYEELSAHWAEEDKKQQDAAADGSATVVESEDSCS